MLVVSEFDIGEIMSRKKMKKARPFEKLLEIMLHGNPVTKEEIAEKLGWTAPRGAKVKGPKIYNVSSYIWDIKNIPQIEGRSIVVKSIRDGKKVTAYQINEKSLVDARAYLKERGLLSEGDAAKSSKSKKVTETA
jgi:hypothetical protein